jgi:hypothetical protein
LNHLFLVLQDRYVENKKYRKDANVFGDKNKITDLFLSELSDYYEDSEEDNIIIYNEQLILHF